MKLLLRSVRKPWGCNPGSGGQEDFRRCGRKARTEAMNGGGEIEAGVGTGAETGTVTGTGMWTATE